MVAPQLQQKNTAVMCTPVHVSMQSHNDSINNIGRMCDADCATHFRPYTCFQRNVGAATLSHSYGTKQLISKSGLTFQSYILSGPAPILKIVQGFEVVFC